MDKKLLEFIRTHEVLTWDSEGVYYINEKNELDIFKG